MSAAFRPVLICLAPIRLALLGMVCAAVAGCAAQVPLPVSVAVPEGERAVIASVRAVRTGKGVQISGALLRDRARSGLRTGRVAVEMDVVAADGSGPARTLSTFATPVLRLPRATHQGWFGAFLPLDRGDKVRRITVRYGADQQETR